MRKFRFNDYDGDRAKLGSSGRHHSPTTTGGGGSGGGGQEGYEGSLITSGLYATWTVSPEQPADVFN